MQRKATKEFLKRPEVQSLLRLAKEDQIGFFNKLGTMLRKAKDEGRLEAKLEAINDEG